MTNKVIPLFGGKDNAHQEFNILLGKNNCVFELDYNLNCKSWFLNIKIGKEYIVIGAVLRINSDILFKYNVKKTFGTLVGVNKDPTLDNIGIDFNLVWIPPANED